MEYVDPVGFVDILLLVDQSGIEILVQVVMGVDIAAGLPLRLELSLLFTKFLMLAFQTNSFVQCMEVWERVTLQLTLLQKNLTVTFKKALRGG